MCKTFEYNTVLDEKDLCDRKKELDELSLMLAKGKKIVIYAPRRYGKTSIARNILPARFASRHKNSISIYVDLMGVGSEEDFSNRLQHALQFSMRKYMKFSAVVDAAKKYLKGLGITVSSGGVPGSEFELKIGNSAGNGNAAAGNLLEAILELSKKRKMLLVFDEFQDISGFSSMMGRLRSSLQMMRGAGILFLGSNRKLLSQVFASRNSPFFNFADDYGLDPIPVAEWLPYFNDRLKASGAGITIEALRELDRIACSVPNTICEIGAYLCDVVSRKKVDVAAIRGSVGEIISRKSQSYRYQTSLLTENEKRFCIALSAMRPVVSILSKDFLAEAGVSASGSKKIFSKLSKAGLVEDDGRNGIRMSNPLLAEFLKNEV